MDFTNITGGLKIPSQIPLNVKEYCENETTLSYLGVNDNLAFTYHDQLIVTCLDEKTKWIWREVKPGEENTGLIPLDFTYPNTSIVFNVDYSNKTFNFFKLNYIFEEDVKEITSPNGTISIVETPTEIQLNVDVNITAGANVTVTEPTPNNFVIDSTDTDTIVELEDGVTTNVIGDGVTTPYSVEVLNLQKKITADYTLTSADNHYTIVVDTTSGNINITIPTGLTANISVNFTQIGTGVVTFVGSSTILNSPIGLKIKGENYWANIYKRADVSETFQLAGALMI